MRNIDFKNFYEKAQKTTIVDDNDFNSNGWVWLCLTERQLIKMFNLMVKQGAIVKNINGRDCIELKNGIKIYK